MKRDDQADAPKLDVSIPSDREIVMSRLFEAPRHLVFAAHTQPELVRRWLLGPPGWSMPVCEIALQVGGDYHYVWSNGQGREFGVGGTYREITPPDRLVHTERFEDGECLVTTLFQEQSGRTLLKTTMLFASQQERDKALESGMDQGVEASYERLGTLLDEQKEDEKRLG